MGLHEGAGEPMSILKIKSGMSNSESGEGRRGGWSLKMKEWLSEQVWGGRLGEGEEQRRRRRRRMRGEKK